MQIQLLFLSARNDELNARSAFVYPPVEISCAFELILILLCSALTARRYPYLEPRALSFLARSCGLACI
jgi:hypothetical protein